MPSVIERVDRQRYTLVNGTRQYDFVPLSDEVVAVTCYAPRMTVRREVSTEEARQQWGRLKSQGYVEW